VLSDPEKRKKYDEYGKDWMHAEEFENARKRRQSSAGTAGQQYASDFGGGNFSDFFESMFGARGFSGGDDFSRGGRVKFRGQDFNAELRLHLQDIYKTQKQTLTINGKNIRITIPAGIENGQTIKIKGHGGPGRNGGPNGDLYITFTIENNTNFRRDGSNLYKTVDLDMYTAVLGGELTTETFDGKVKLKIKPETQNGAVVKLKGKGFPIYKQEGRHGDLFITYNVKTPSNLTTKEKELFQQLVSLKK
jgi:curved DNA-binding protein